MGRKTFWQILGSTMLLLATPIAAGAAAEALAPAIQLFESRRYEEARKLFEPYAIRNPKDPDAVLYLGRTYFYLEKYETAAGWFEKVAALTPKQSGVQLWLARSYGRAAQEASVFKQVGLAKNCKAAYEKTIVLDPGNLEARSELIQYYLLAPGFMGGSVEKAREQAAEIRKRDAVRGVLAFVTIHMNQKDPAAAERELKQAVQKTPAEPRLRVALGNFYQGQEKWEAAFETLEAVVKADPDRWDALYQIGRAGALSGQRLDRAEQCLKRYLAHTPSGDDPSLAHAHFRLGMVYEKKGDRTQARAEYRTALKLDPGLKDAQEALKKLG
jgi:tetratricopeptide (TPR) repeat protein